MNDLVRIKMDAINHEKFGPAEDIKRQIDTLMKYGTYSGLKRKQFSRNSTAMLIDMFPRSWRYSEAPTYLFPQLSQLRLTKQCCKTFSIQKVVFAMSSQPSLSLLLPRRLVTQTTEQKYRYTPPRLAVPKPVPSSRFSQYSLEDLVSTLSDLYHMHLGAQMPIYFEHHQEVNAMVKSIMPILKTTLSPELIRLAAHVGLLECETFKQYVDVEEYFILANVFYHFRALVRSSGIYNTPELKEKLANLMVSWLTPSEFEKADIPLLSSMIPADPRSSQILRRKPSFIVKLTPNLDISMASGDVEFRCKMSTEINLADDKTLTLNIDNNDVFLINEANPYWKAYVMGHVNITGQIATSASAIAAVEEYPLIFADGLARMFLTYDATFTKIVWTNVRQNHTVARAIYNVYRYYRQTTRFLKYCIYYEILECKDEPERAFSTNTAFVSILNEYIEKECDNYTYSVLGRILLGVVNSQTFDIDRPAQDKVPVIDQMINLLLERITESVDLIPPKVRGLLAYARFCGEKIWGVNKEGRSAIISVKTKNVEDLSQKPVCALFLTNYISETFQKPDKLVYRKEAETMQYKAHVFARLVKEIATMGYETGDRKGTLDKIIVRFNDRIVQMIEAITKDPPDRHDEGYICGNVVEVLDAAPVLKQWLVDNMYLLKSERWQFVPAIFVHDVVDTLYSRMIKF